MGKFKHINVIDVKKKGIILELVASVVIGLCSVKTNNTGLDWIRLDIVQ